MFESAELRQEVSKADYEAAVPALREALLDAQYDLPLGEGLPRPDHHRRHRGAGKSETVQTLNEWLDPVTSTPTGSYAHGRGGGASDHVPLLACPAAEGATGIFFGSWYSLPMVSRVLGMRATRILTGPSM